MFIDRSGDLFATILQFLRTNTLPARKLLRDIRHELQHECEFFGMAHMLCRLQGEISEYDMRVEDRALKEDEGSGAESYKLLDVFKLDTSPMDPRELQVPLLPPHGGARPKIVESYCEFVKRSDKLPGGQVRHLGEAKGAVFAGGAVLGALAGTPIGDIDIFLFCTPAGALGIARNVFAAAQAIHKQRCGPRSKLLVARSSHSLAFF